MNTTRIELIHELVSRAMAEGLRNDQIRNRISSFARGPEERREGLDYLTLLRTKRGEDINIFSGESNVSEGFRSVERPTARDVVIPSAQGVERTSGAPRASRGLTDQMIRKATAEVRADTHAKPSRGDVAERLGTSESTLRRAMQELEMGPWPPSPSRD